jgi:hypothetical protein
MLLTRRKATDWPVASGAAHPGFRLTGPITRADVATVRQFIAEHQRAPAEDMSVGLDSPGGDVDAAISIGDMLREEGAGVFMYEGDRCFSACVFVLVAGSTRLIGSAQIGIHRPRFDATYFAGLSAKGAQRRYDELAANVRAYLARMGMPDDLYAAMMRVPSNELRLLTPAEVRAWELDGVTAAYAEWWWAGIAKREGKDER